MPASQESGVTSSRRLGIIAGAGMLPIALAQKCAEQNILVAVVALQGFAQVSDFSPHIRAEMPIGRGRSMIGFFREHNVQDVVMIGAVRRPSLWDVRPDFWTLSRLGGILMRGGLGDDGLLRAVRSIFEKEGFQVQGVQTYLPDLIAQSGQLGKCAPNETDMFDIRRGFQVAHALGSVDVGQSVVIQAGIVLGVEAAEGTSELIKRCAALKRNGPGPILIKAAKPGQDKNMDLPTIGPDTVIAVQAAGFRGIAVQSGATLVVQPIDMMAQADAAQIFIYGYSP